MRGNIPEYELRTAQTVDEVLLLMKKEPGVWRPFSGGTDLMVQLEMGKLQHKKFVSLWGLKELQGISASAAEVKIGALTTYAQIIAHPHLKQVAPLLTMAAQQTAALAIQNRGTIGGNIANASPAADTPPALLCLDAEIEIRSVNGSRWLPYSEFHTGYKKMQLSEGEIISSIRFANNKLDWKFYYRKVGTRAAQAISKVILAAGANVDTNTKQIRDVRIALGSVAATTIRANKTENQLRGQKITDELMQNAKKILATEIAPQDDIRSTKEYRMRVAQNLLEEFLLTTVSESE